MNRGLCVAILALAAGFLGGCAHIPGKCCRRPSAKEDKATLLHGSADRPPAFVERTMHGGQRSFKVFIPSICLDARKEPRRDQPPILLCHEMSTLSPGALELATRLGREGFTVYVPILFGNEDEDPNSTLLAAQRFLFFAPFNREWKANSAASERPIAQALAELCRNDITPHHHRRDLGIIGLCISGILPVQILGQEQPIPHLKAMVVSQPSIPVFSGTLERQRSLGISTEEEERAKTRVAHEKLQILGFRFEGDQVCTELRFTHLTKTFGIARLGSMKYGFIDSTLPKSGYELRDGFPADAHAVLTDGYCAARSHSGPSAGQQAYRRLVWYLKAKLVKGVSHPVPEFGNGDRNG